MAGAFEIARAVRSYFERAWANETPIAYDNEPYEPGGEPWVRMLVREALDERVNLGSEPGLRRRRILGVVHVQCFTRLDEGVGDEARLVDRIKSIFRDVRLSNPSVKFGSIGFGSPGPDGKWRQANVTVEYEADALH